MHQRKAKQLKDLLILPIFFEDASALKAEGVARRRGNFASALGIELQFELGVLLVTVIIDRTEAHSHADALGTRLAASRVFMARTFLHFGDSETR